MYDLHVTYWPKHFDQMLNARRGFPNYTQTTFAIPVTYSQKAHRFCHCLHWLYGNRKRIVHMEKHEIWIHLFFANSNHSKWIIVLNILRSLFFFVGAMVEFLEQPHDFAAIIPSPLVHIILARFVETSVFICPF